MSKIYAPTRAEIISAAEQERHVLLAQEMAHHLYNARNELRRYEDAIKHIEDVYRLRLSGLQPETPADTAIPGAAPSEPAAGTPGKTP
jgi:hypothetical protein